MPKVLSIPASLFRLRQVMRRFSEISQLPVDSPEQEKKFRAFRLMSFGPQENRQCLARGILAKGLTSFLNLPRHQGPTPIEPSDQQGDDEQRAEEKETSNGMGANGGRGRGWEESSRRVGSWRSFHHPRSQCAPHDPAKGSIAARKIPGGTRFCRVAGVIVGVIVASVIVRVSWLLEVEIEVIPGSRRTDVRFESATVRLGVLGG